MELVIKRTSHWRLLILVGSGQLLASGQIGFQDSLVIIISGRNQFMSLSGHCHFVFLFYFLASFIKPCRGPFNYGLLIKSGNFF